MKIKYENLDFLCEIGYADITDVVLIDGENSVCEDGVYFIYDRAEGCT